MVKIFGQFGSSAKLSAGLLRTLSEKVLCSDVIPSQWDESLDVKNSPGAFNTTFFIIFYHYAN